MLGSVLLHLSEPVSDKSYISVCLFYQIVYSSAKSVIFFLSVSFLVPGIHSTCSRKLIEFQFKYFYMKMYDTYNVSMAPASKVSDYFEVPVQQMPYSSFIRSQHSGLCISTFSSWEFCLIIDYIRELNSAPVTGKNEWTVLLTCLIYEH